MRSYADIIETTTCRLNVPVRVVREWEAPQAYCFELEPVVQVNARGNERVTRVRSLKLRHDSLALALGVHSVSFSQNGRLVLVVPKPKPDRVLTSSLCARSEMQGLLPVRLGRTLMGQTLNLDIAGTPHLLIAGATGSGKSICVKNIIGELMRWNPAFCKNWNAKTTGRGLELRLIDLKRVELGQFREAPHVSTIAAEPEHAKAILVQALQEIEARYRQMQAAGVSDIEGTINLHRIVIVIDEFADLILQDDSITSIIVRIAQLGRAAGIHLIMATQRPSVDVVAGLIKANFPTRIAFRVASGADSRVVLDQKGAEELLGRGDGLLLTADYGLVRFQGALPDKEA